MQLGSLIIYDYDGNIFLNTGDMEGDVLPYKLPNGLPYIITKYGELKNKIVKGVDVKSKKLITEDIEIIETKEEKLLKEKKELENQLLIFENKKLGGIL